MSLMVRMGCTHTAETAPALEPHFAEGATCAPGDLISPTRSAITGDHLPRRTKSENRHSGAALTRARLHRRMAPTTLG